MKVLATPQHRSPPAHLIALPGREPKLVHARASSFLCLASLTRTAAHLIEPPEPRTTLWSATRDWMDDWSHISARNAVSEPAPDPTSTMTTTALPARLA